MRNDVLPLKFVETMVSIDFKNRCSTDKMIIDLDLRKIDDRKMKLKELQNSADLIGEFCSEQHKLGISPFWIEDAFDIITVFIRAEEVRISKEEEGAKSRLATIDRQVKEFEQKEKKRKGKSAKKT